MASTDHVSRSRHYVEQFHRHDVVVARPGHSRRIRHVPRRDLFDQKMHDSAVDRRRHYRWSERDRPRRNSWHCAACYGAGRSRSIAPRYPIHLFHGGAGRKRVIPEWNRSSPTDSSHFELLAVFECGDPLPVHRRRHHYYCDEDQRSGHHSNRASGDLPIYHRHDQPQRQDQRHIRRVDATQHIESLDCVRIHRFQQQQRQQPQSQRFSPHALHCVTRGTTTVIHSQWGNDSRRLRGWWTDTNVGLSHDDWWLSCAMHSSGTERRRRRPIGTASATRRIPCGYTIV